jgi:integrase
MILVDQCTGPRAGELLALGWEAVDFEQLCIKVKEGVVNGRIGPVKTEYSEDELPLDPHFATVLLEIKRKSNGPVCCSRVLTPDALTMLLRSSRTTSAARDGVLLRVLVVARFPGRHARRMAHLSAQLSDLAQRRRHPDRRPAKAASARPNLEDAAVRRSAYGEPAPGDQ